MTTAQLLSQGWTVNPTSLYDEEGVEGWTWIAPDGREFTVIGDWNESPPMPDFIPTDYRREQTARMVEFLNGLLRGE